MIIKPCTVSAFCVRVVSVVPIIFRKCRINFSTKFLVNRGLFLKSFVRTFHTQISAYACLVNETQCLCRQKRHHTFLVDHKVMIERDYFCMSL